MHFIRCESLCESMYIIIHLLISFQEKSEKSESGGGEVLADVGVFSKCRRNPMGGGGNEKVLFNFELLK